MLDALDRFANNGIQILATTPDPTECRFYIAKFCPKGQLPWKYLHHDGWRTSKGVAWHHKFGSRVACPTFLKPSEALCFALEVENRLGDLVFTCPVYREGYFATWEI